jgi:hypothetical protein
MLDSGFREANLLHMDGSVVIPLPDDDPDAMIILMNIVHGKTRKVPRQIDLDLLVELANLVDYYQMLEVVEPWSDFWVQRQKHLKSDWAWALIHPYVHRYALERLWISWVFQRPVEFKTTSWRIQRQGQDDQEWPVDSNVPAELEQEAEKLPIPQSILSMSRYRCF